MFIDGHCDTASVMLDMKKVLKKNTLHLDLSRMPKGYTQVFAAFSAPEYYQAPMQRVEAIIAKIKAEAAKKTNKIEICTDNEQRLKAIENGNCAAFISVEGAEAVKRVEDVGHLYELGVRFMSLTWNNENALAGGVDSSAGLTVLGRNVIGEMGKKGMILDVSHLNDRSFWEAMRVTLWPVIASHSCSRSVYKHKRNLTDEQFRAICARGGVVGINFYPKFLNGRNTAYIKNIIRHIDRFIKLGGENNIGLGSDFDGVETLPQDLKGVEDMPVLRNAFLEHGYSQKLTDKICFGNFERILRLL